MEDDLATNIPEFLEASNHAAYKTFFFVQRLLFKNSSGDPNISCSLLNLPFFTFSSKQWAFKLTINKSNHHLALIFAKYFWSWSVDPISKFWPYLKSQLWTLGHISSSRMNFEPKLCLGDSLGCRKPTKTGIMMGPATGSTGI